MRYIQVCMDCPQDELEIRCEQMSALGVGGFIIESEEDLRLFLENNRQYWDYVDQALLDQYAGLSRIKCYLTDDEAGRSLLARLRADYGPVQTAYVEDGDWANSWRAYYKPIPVGRRLLVVPEWEAVPAEDRLVLRLDPGLIFGTGSHATTRLCLQALEERVGGGERVLDLGCGSGILGIAALLLGAESCLGCDVDPKAPDVVMANAALNGLGPARIQARAGDLLSDSALRRSFGGGYDLALANIVSDVIIPLCPHVPELLAESGLFICSGIIEGRQAEVRAALAAAGLHVLEERREEDWTCFVATRQN